MKHLILNDSFKAAFSTNVVSTTPATTRKIWYSRISKKTTTRALLDSMKPEPLFMGDFSKIVEIARSSDEKPLRVTKHHYKLKNIFDLGAWYNIFFVRDNSGRAHLVCLDFDTENKYVGLSVLYDHHIIHRGAIIGAYDRIHAM